MSSKPVAQYFLGETLRVVGGGALTFWCAGRIDWWPAWAALAVVAAMAAAIGIVGIRNSPDWLAERIGPRKGDALWDVAVYGVIRLGTGACFFLAGMDQRHGWTGGVPVEVQIVGLALYFLGCALFVWATASNMFFSIMVRIQTTGRHTVATGGPYRFVRHPGYVGAIVGQLALPMLFASWWALVPSVAVVAVYLIRTALEDRTLQVKLAGYADFAQRVRYRLLPGVW